jgi:hypothetical protein
LQNPLRLAAGSFTSSISIFLASSQYYLFEIIRFAFYNLERLQGAFPDAGTEAVAVFFRSKARLTVYNPDRAFHTGRDALRAAIAFLFINIDNFSFNFHGYFLSWYHLRQGATQSFGQGRGSMPRPRSRTASAYAQLAVLLRGQRNRTTRNARSEFTVQVLLEEVAF